MKKPLLFTLLLFLVAFAWAETYVIGTGTSASGLYPIYGYYDYSWSKQVYTAAEINAAGLNEAASITGIGLYVGNTPANFVMADQRIYLRHSTLTTYTTVTDETGTGYPANSGFSQVFQGTLTFNGGGWIYITFDTAFAWNNTDNIEILWENWCLAGVTGYPTFRYTSTSPDYRNVYKYQDGSFPAVAGTRSTSRPNITIITPQVDPPNPAVLVYPANAGYCFLDGVLSWSDGGGMPDGYDVYLDTVDGSTLVSNDQPGTSYTPTLAPNTTYYWKVVPYNANGPATGVTTWSFKTPTADQIAESFDATEFPPLGWTTPGGAFTRSTTTPYYGAASAYEYIAAGPSYLHTSMLELTATSELDWWMRTSATTGIGRVQIVYSEDGTTWNNIGDEIVMPTETTWMNYNVDLSSLAGNNYMIGFKVYSSTSTSTYFYIDHVFGPNFAAVVPGPVTLSAPANAAVDVAAKPTFTWTAPTNGGIPTGYRVYCDTNANPSTLIGDVTALTYTATTALAYSTTYFWKVVAYNGTGNSADSDIRSFTTMADPTIYTMPWLENFGTDGDPFPPTNWALYSGLMVDPIELTTGTSYWYQDDFANVVESPSNESGKMNIYSTSRKGWLVSPPIQMPGAGYQLEFDIALTDYGSSNPPDDPAGLSGVDDRFAVLIGDGVTWATTDAVKIWDNDDLTSGGIYEVYNSVSHTGDHWVIPLDGYTGIKYVAFYGESTVANADNDFFVDNVRIRLAGQAPEHVTLLNPADQSTTVDPGNCTLNWQNAVGGGDPGWYEIYVGTDLIDPANEYYGEYLYETTNSNLDLSAQVDIDLGFNTTWYWAVLPFNEYGNPDPTSGLQVFRFTTLPDPTIVALPHAEYFDSVTAPALPYGWSSVVEATTTYAYVNTYSSTTYAVSTPNVARMYNSSDTAANLLLITPDFSMALNTIKVRFYARSSTAGEDLYIGAYNPTTQVFTQIGAVMDLTTTQTQYSVPLTAYAGSDVFLAFKHGVGTSTRTIYIDNVEFIEILANDLAATALAGDPVAILGNTLSGTVTVLNDGTATQNSYTVKLINADTQAELASLDVTTPLAGGNSAQHTLQYTPAAAGTYNVLGKVVLAGDQNTANDATGPVSVLILPAGYEILSAGDPESTTTANTLPTNVYYKNGVTEVLYYEDELHLQSGSITHLAYHNNFTQALTAIPFKIWMGSTDRENLNDAWVSPDSLTLVFDGTLDLPLGENLVIIPLQTAFAYNGGNFVIRWNRVLDTVFYSSSNVWYYTDTAATTPDRSKYVQSDGTVYDPLAPSAAGTILDRVPNTWFAVDNAVMQQSGSISGNVYIAGTSTPLVGATVTLAEDGTATTDENGFYEFIFWEAGTYTASASLTNYYSSTPVSLSVTPGSITTHNFYLQPLPQVTVSGTVNTNDIPGGIEGATVALSGYQSYEVTSGANGVFSIPNVYGLDTGQVYTVTVDMAGYQSYSGTTTVYDSNLDLGTITLNEYLWTPYELVATHEGDNARLNWEAAGEPDYLFFDFEADNGGWVGSGYGDWEWTNAYTLTGYSDPDTYVDTPPTSAYSGDGLWGTKVLSSYSNAGAWSYLRQTFDLSPFANPVLSFWHYMDGYNDWDYGLIKVNGTLVWGDELNAELMPWQQLTVDLSAYAGMASVEISFEWYATSTVAYAGWYIDDIYIGPATTRHQTAQFGARNDNRFFLNYDVYRFLAADEGTPANWTLIDGAVADTTFLDTGFAALGEGSYKWAVKANYSGTLESEAIISNALGIFITPPDVENGTIGATGNNVTIAWPAEPGASYYTVYGSNDPYAPDPWAILGYSATPSFTFDAGATAYKFFKITASDGEMPASKGVWPQLNK